MDHSTAVRVINQHLVIVAMPHKPTSNMSDLSNVIKDSVGYVDDSISINFLPDHEKLSDRVPKKALNNFTQGYIHDIKIYSKDCQGIKVIARCWCSCARVKISIPYTQNWQTTRSLNPIVVVRLGRYTGTCPRIYK